MWLMANCMGKQLQSHHTINLTLEEGRARIKAS